MDDTFAKTIMQGRVVRMTDVLYKGKGARTAVVNFTIAVNGRSQNSHGEWHMHKNFFDCAVFGQKAVRFAASVKDGDMCMVDSNPFHQRWTNKKTGVKFNRVMFLVKEVRRTKKAKKNLVEDPEVEAAKDDEYMDYDEIFY